jgi:glucose-6-phosphate dehydrogenase assembly protein OpcA
MNLSSATAGNGGAPEAMPTGLETFTGGVATEVDVAGIERQLAELWQMAAGTETDAARRQITRASLFNLVTVCETEQDRDTATEVIRALTSRHPCRAIVVLADTAGGASELSASISAHCHLAGGAQKQVCCEQISVNARGDGVARLIGVMLPLLESDLPVVLWWRGNFLSRRQLFDRFVAVADRVMFDTSMWPAAQVDLGALAAMIEQSPRVNFADLSWTRLSLWRRMTAEAFDEPTCAQQLAGVDAVCVIHGTGPGARLRGLLFASWVAAQLDWPAGDAARCIKLEAREDTDATSVGMISIELRSTAGSFVVRKNYGERTAIATVTLPHVCGLPRKRAFWPTDEASLMNRELERVSAHHVYLRVLKMAAAVMPTL